MKLSENGIFWIILIYLKKKSLLFTERRRKVTSHYKKRKSEATCAGTSPRKGSECGISGGRGRRRGR